MFFGQVTFLEPYFEADEVNERRGRRITEAERNVGLERFVFSTPFIPRSGRTHGDLREQHKRKTIVSVAHAFPYIVARQPVLVDATEVRVIGPVAVACEDIERRVDELVRVTHAEPVDLKLLQMLLQGCIGNVTAELITFFHIQ